MSFNINDVEQIQVSFLDGRPDVIYKNKGLEKIRRLMLTSPALGEEVQVIDTFSEEESISPVPAKKTTKKPTKKPSVPSGGYETADLQYAPTAGKSAMELAREMQKQAEQNSKINFG